jgi:hypothetical protein
MILRATGALADLRRFKFGNDLVDIRGVAFDRVRDRAAT